MRIVQALGWYLPDSLGGTELYVARLAEQITAAGHEVMVAAPDPAAQTERHYIHDGVLVYRYPIARRVTRAQARGEALVPGADAFHRWLASTRPDVVHFHTFVTGLGLREVQAARATGARVIVTSHAGSLGFLCERGTLMRDGRHLCDGAVADPVCAGCALQMRGIPGASLIGRLSEQLSRAALIAPGRVGTVLGMRALIADNRRAQRELFAAIDAFVVLSDHAARALMAAGAPAEKVIVNRLGVGCSSTSVRRRESLDRTVVCGFVGRAQPIKGLEDAVRAVVSLPAHLAVQLRAVVIATTDEDRRVLRRCREWAHNDARVSFEAAVAPAEVPALLATLDVLLCPSRVVEGGPTIALEAHAVGTPVIGSRLPALSELVTHEHNGLLHGPADWRDLATCLARVAVNPGMLEQWRARLAPVRTQDLVARDYLAVYGAIPRFAAVVQ